MSLTSSRHYLRQTALFITVVILFGVLGSIAAQDAATDVPPTTISTDAPTSAPTDIPPTDVPTLVPTNVPPTAMPTDVPTSAPTDVPTSAPTDAPSSAVPTDVPAEVTTIPVTAAPTVEVMPSPTLVSEPPVFNFANGTTFEAVAGSPTVIQATITDQLGVVSIVSAPAPAPVGAVNFTTVAPTETTAPFNTLLTFTYTPLPAFSGVDSITLIAINLAGIQSRITLTINVTAEAITPTPTLTPTPLPEPMQELIISYDARASEAAIQSMLSSLGAVELGRIPQIGAMRVLVPQSKATPSKAMATIQSAGTARLAGVTHAEQNLVYHLSFTPNDPKYPQQWGLSNQLGTSPVGGSYVSNAWDMSTARGLGINVAVVDSGVDLQHLDLQLQTVPGWDFVNDDSNPDDDYGHGTHVAGIIAAKANNGIGMAGVAFNAKIMPIKSCDKFGACPLYYVAEGIIYATDMGARVINLSLSSTDNFITMQGAINYALSRNVVVVAAAGNYGCSSCVDPNNSTPSVINPVEYPAAYPGVISVGAHDSSGTIWEDTTAGSTHNSNVLISAPGVAVPSLWPIELDTQDGIKDGYTTQTGTSMAAAYASGVAALLESAKVATTPATVRDALICGAEDDIPNSGRDDSYGYGRLRADMSMNWQNNSNSCKVTLPNDNFQNAAVITTLPYSIIQPVSDRSVTEQISDPQICGAPRQQTLWYKYQPAAAGYYQFTTLGSSYTPVVGVFRGTEGALTSIGCVATTPSLTTPTLSSTPQQFMLPLDALQIYYIAVATDTTDNSVVDNQILQLRINPAVLPNNIDIQEASPVFAYVGMWSVVPNALASGGYTRQTSDTNAMVVFSFRGTSFQYARTVGPDRGSVKIYVNGALLTTISNQGAVTKANQLTPVINLLSPVIGSWNTVYIQPDSSVPGVVDIDRIRTYDFDATTVAGVINSASTNELADDRDVRLRYLNAVSSSDWVKLSSATYLSTLSETAVQNAGVAFRFNGNAVNLTRMTGPGFADMQVTIDNGLPIIVSNLGDNATAVNRQYMIDNLPIMQHVVEIRKLGATGTIQLDSVQGLVRAIMAVGTTYDERTINIAYRGVVTNNTVTGAYTSTTRSFTNGSDASFKFSGNDLCIGYQRSISSFTVDVYVDGTQLPPITWQTGSGFTAWCMENTLHTLLADTVHYVRLVPQTGTFTLDYIKPLRYVTLTPARGMVQETDTSFRYSTPTAWSLLTTTAKSAGGFAPRGGSLKRTTMDENTITFYMNGTGFILYTAVGSNSGCWKLTIDDVASNPIDLTSPGVAQRRYRPLGYGISGLTPGIHRIQLTADTNCSSIFPPNGLPSSYPVDFDAVRVFP